VAFHSSYLDVINHLDQELCEEVNEREVGVDAEEVTGFENRCGRGLGVIRFVLFEGFNIRISIVHAVHFILRTTRVRDLISNLQLILVDFVVLFFVERRTSLYRKGTVLLNCYSITTVKIYELQTDAVKRHKWIEFF